MICGCVLLLASVHSESSPLDFAALIKFIAEQLQTSAQLQWFFGIIFLSAGIFFIPGKVVSRRSFRGAKELSNDSYVLYLVDKYHVEKSLALDQIIAQDKIFPSIDDALLFIHQLECPQEINLPLPVKSSIEPSFAPREHTKSEVDTQPLSELEALKNPFSTTQVPDPDTHQDARDEARRNRIITVLGIFLFITLLGGLIYAISHSVQPVTPSAVPVVPASNPTMALPATQNSDQVVSGSITSQQPLSAAETKDSSKPAVVMPINERWIGMWNQEGGGKQKLLVTANLLKFADEEFTWTGVRPKGVLQCCLAFYEGATSKADLVARISGAQDPITLKPEAQKTLGLINSLSEGNFKRIVFADPSLKKYFFINDQNFVYRISRDLGDKVDVVVEQYKRQE
jgi:hypothetical protein